MGRFRDALANEGLTAIAEVKRRSPSAGELRPDADPAVLAAAFERAGAAAVSILVDERFGGTPADLAAARSASDVPLLAKGFFSGRAELEELRSLGADAVLLLLRDLDDSQAHDLMTTARELGLDALVEAHDAGELARAVELGADPIGINARDLSTFRIDRRAQLELVEAAPRDRVVIAESAIAARAHGAGGIDELSPTGPNFVCEVVDGGVRTRNIDPLEFGIERCDPSELRGGSPAENAAAIRAVFAGENGGRRSAILLNAAGAIAAAGHADDLRAGLEVARDAVDSGAALARLDALVAFSQTAEVSA